MRPTTLYRVQRSRGGLCTVTAQSQVRKSHNFPSFSFCLLIPIFNTSLSGARATFLFLPVEIEGGFSPSSVSPTKDTPFPPTVSTAACKTPRSEESWAHRLSCLRRRLNVPSVIIGTETWRQSFRLLVPRYYLVLTSQQQKGVNYYRRAVPRHPAVSSPIDCRWTRDDGQRWWERQFRVFRRQLAVIGQHFRWLEWQRDVLDRVGRLGRIVVDAGAETDAGTRRYTLFGARLARHPPHTHRPLWRHRQLNNSLRLLQVIIPLRNINNGWGNWKFVLSSTKLDAFSGTLSCWIRQHASKKERNPDGIAVSRGK